MKIMIGDHLGAWGTLELAPDGSLKMAGDRKRLRSAVRALKREGEDNAAFLADLPGRLNSYHTWARQIDDQPKPKKD